MVAPSVPRIGRAAMYVRMSTEHQQYSTENQADSIEKYAIAQGLTIVQRFVDYGKSGLTLAGRTALRDLLRTVESGQADFEKILVYDVSRWGRFQDADESGYYEYVCKRAGVYVHYCAEQFENDGSLSSSLLKTLKRSMAGEYSRELSVKVFAGQCRLIELGYRQGGHAGFGLRRQLVDRENKPKALLDIGEQKSLQTDRVILVPGPEDEVSIVRDVYESFTVDRRSEGEIADLLNERGITSDLGRRWSRGTVHQLLTNPKYVGANVYNRHSFKLKKKRVTNPAEMWIRRDQAFEAIVPIDHFVRAQEIIEARHFRLADEDMLEQLRGLLQRIGTLSGVLIDEDEETPSSGAFRTRFKSLHRAYGLIGYKPERDFSYIEANQKLREQHRQHWEEIVSRLRLDGATVEQSGNGLLLINGEFTTSLVLARSQETISGGHRWLIRLEASLLPDVTIAARLKPGNTDVLDYYLLPSVDQLSKKLALREENPFSLDVYRFDTLEFFMSLGRRRALGAAA